MLAKLSSMRMMSQASLATSVPAIPCEETGVLSHLVGRPLHWQLTTTVHQPIHSTRNVLLSYHSHSQFDTLLIPILTALSYLMCYHFPSIPILYYPLPTPTSVPRTIAKPTSALFSAGPSLVPSPVTATTSLLGLTLDLIMWSTKVYLSVGEDRARTRSCGQISSNLAWDT